MITVTILTTTHASTGGVERFVSYLEKELILHECAVTIIAKQDLRPWQQKIIGLAKYVASDQIVLGYFLGCVAMRGTSDVVITNGLLGWNIRNKKVINVHHGTFIKGALRTRHDDVWIKYIIKRYWWSWFEQKAARGATVCAAVSEETRQSVMHYYRAKNVVTIPNAIDTDLFVPNTQEVARKSLGLPLDKKIVFFASRLGSQKAGQLVLAIAQHIKKTRPNVIVVGAVFGQQFSQESGIIGLDNGSYDRLVMAYNAADVFLLPSRHEGSSLALLESMACGLPFLASPVGLVPELLEKKLFTECIVSEPTVDAYMNHLNKLLGLSTDDQIILAQQLRTYVVEHHNLQQFGNNYFSLIKTITSL
ncbi:MAG: glycosyltransferase family 4 protein [bacterium]